VILPEDFTEENGYLTPSIKVKRGKVIEDYAELIATFYDEARARRDA
jgi:long-chain acyl-CoA synthetase